MGTYRSLLTIIDRTVIHRRSRWTVLIFCCAIVLYRSIVYEYLAVCTVFGSYISYSLVEYFTPLGLPDPDEDTPQTILKDSILTDISDDKPVLRSLNQFSLWKKLIVAILCCWLCTMFQMFQVPVYWPFILIYLFWLVILTICKHLHHMRKYGYSFDDFDTRRETHFMDITNSDILQVSLQEITEENILYPF